MEDTMITAEEAMELERRLQLYRNQQAELAAIRATATYHKLKPVVESVQCAEFHQMLTEAMVDGQDTSFSVHANALIEIMPRLVETVANFVPYVPALVVDPVQPMLPGMEGSTDG